MHKIIETLIKEKTKNRESFTASDIFQLLTSRHHDLFSMKELREVREELKTLKILGYTARRGTLREFPNSLILPMVYEPETLLIELALDEPTHCIDSSELGILPKPVLKEVDEYSRLLIPKHLLESIGLKKGNKATIIKNEESLFISKNTRPTRKVLTKLKVDKSGNIRLRNTTLNNLSTFSTHFKLTSNNENIMVTSIY
jgi:bifunctional DNA-binding transcriptional regulator/antitoxin component of YhaV-PrlF toxin-antitoxin module